MSNVVQHTTFEKISLNSDDSHLFFENGATPYNLNILVSEDGSQGIVTNAKGNLQIQYPKPLTLSKCYEVKGSYYNYLQRACYYLIFSQPYDSGSGVYLYDNRLVRYNEDSQTIDDIFYDQHNYFGISPSQHLTDIKMIESWLFFNPVTDEPKMIDVDMAYNYTNYPAWDDTDPSASAQLGDTYTWKGGLFVANTDISAGEDPSTATTKWDRIGNAYQDESTLSGGTDMSRAFLAIKIPPIDRIVASYASDSSRNVNKVRDRVFRFCHRYQYFDNNYSVCSSHSELALAKDDELYNGKVPTDITINNYIKLSLGLYSPSLIKNVEVFCQELGDQTWGDWKRISIINRQDQSLLDDNAYVINFYNNETYPVIDQKIPYVIFDAVPDRVASQEIINKNILCYAGCTEGKPNLDKDLINVTLTAVREQISESSGVSVLKRDNIVSNDWTDVTYTLDGRISPFSHLDIVGWYASASLANNDVFLVNINNKILSYTIKTEDIVSIGTFIAALKMFFQTYFPELSVRTDDTTMIELGQRAVRPTIILSKFYTPTAGSQDTFTKKNGFKTGATHPFCLFYYDDPLRRGDAQINSTTNVYVPTINEFTPSLVTTDYRFYITWAVNHKPPSWAKYWRWGYAGNRKCSWFVQYIISSVADTVAGDDIANAVKIDITPLQTVRTTKTLNWNAFPNSTIPEYDFTPGDRIRFITAGTNDPSFSGEYLNDVIADTLDFEIIAFNVETNMIYINGKTTDITGVGENSLVEIYTPIRDSSSLDVTKTLTYYEFGDLMEIKEDVNGNLVHCGANESQDQVYGVTPATGTFYNGDVYHIKRTPSKPLSTDTWVATHNAVFHESMAWSDFYPSDDWSKGKLGLESAIGQVELNIVRYSNPYLQNTSVNGITTFEANNFKELNDTFGKITSIVEVGDTLKCYQEKKASSILIGRTSYFSANGDSTEVEAETRPVQTRSFILGTIEYRPSNYGTTFPESISKNNRYVYGFDIYSGVVWRDSPTGIFPISGRYADIGGSVDYKMQSYFKAKSKALLSSGVEHCHVMTVWDEEYKMLYVLFKDTVNEANNECVVFHEPSDRWITFTDQFWYQPSESYNQMLELEYSVVKGFENGLGYEFDEASRFAVFNIGRGAGTPPKMNIEPRTISKTMALGTPTFATVVAPTPLPATNISGNAFSANWIKSTGATGYYLDVATDSGFSAILSDYNNKDVSDVSTYPVTGLTLNTAYFYRLRAYNTVGTTLSGNWISQRTSSPPDTVVSKPATDIQLTSFRANWEAVTGATGYYLDVATDSLFASKLTGYDNRLINSQFLLWIVNGLTPSTQYYYRLKAVNDRGVLSVNYSVTVNVETLVTPTVASGATGVTTTSFYANWSAVAEAAKYLLEVARDVNFVNKLDGYTTGKDVGSVTTWQVTGLSANTDYYFRVKVENARTRQSVYSNISGLKTNSVAPVATAATNISGSGFRANWEAVAGARWYYIDVSENIEFSGFVGIYNSFQTGEGLSYDVAGLTPNTTYYYRVRAYGYTDWTDYSATITTTTTALPLPAPEALQATDIGDTYFTICWNSSENAAGYKVDVSTTSLFYSYVEGWEGNDVGNNVGVGISGLQPDEGYCYRIRSYNESGVESPYSEVIFVGTLSST